jgi:hypothetical protein
MVVVDLVTLFAEKTYSFEELVESQTLTPDFITRVIIPIIPIMLITGVVIGRCYGKDNKTIIPSIFVNVLVLLGIGHNVPLTNMVLVENFNLFLEMKIFFYVILVFMVTSYGVCLIIIEKVLESKQIMISI